VGLGAPLVPAAHAKPAPARHRRPRASACSHRDRFTAFRVILRGQGTIFGALIEAIDLSQLAKLDADSSREEIRDIVNEIIAIKNIVDVDFRAGGVLDDICNDVLGYGPLEPLLARDDIADILVNGSGTTYIEVKGKIQKTGIPVTSDNQQLAQHLPAHRTARSAGASTNPRPDLRCPPPRRLPRQCDRAAASPSTGRPSPSASSRRTKLTLEQLVRFGTITPDGAEILKVIGRCRVTRWCPAAPAPARPR